MDDFFRCILDTLLKKSHTSFVSYEISVPPEQDVRRQLSKCLGAPDPIWLIQKRQDFFAGRNLKDLLASEKSVDFCLPLLSGAALRYYQWYFITIFYRGVYWAVISYVEGDGFYVETEADYPIANFILSGSLCEYEISSNEEKEIDVVKKIASMVAGCEFLDHPRSELTDIKLSEALRDALGLLPMGAPPK